MLSVTVAAPAPTGSETSFEQFAAEIAVFKLAEDTVTVFGAVPAAGLITEVLLRPIGVSFKFGHKISGNGGGCPCCKLRAADALNVACVIVSSAVHDAGKGVGCKHPCGKLCKGFTGIVCNHGGFKHVTPAEHECFNADNGCSGRKIILVNAGFVCFRCGKCRNGRKDD